MGPWGIGHEIWWERESHDTGNSDGILVEVSEEQRVREEGDHSGRFPSEGDKSEAAGMLDRSTGDHSDPETGSDALRRRPHFKDGMERLIRGFNSTGNGVTQLDHPVLHRPRGTVDGTYGWVSQCVVGGMGAMV